jgi:hypothetical protein
VIIEFAIADKGHIGEDVPKIEGFSPADMSEGKIRLESLLLKVQQHTGNSLPVKHVFLHICQIRMGCLCRFPMGFVNSFEHLLEGLIFNARRPAVDRCR